LDTGGVSDKTDLAWRVIDAFNRRDFDALYAETAPDAVFDWSRSIGPQRGVYRGEAEARLWNESFLEVWEEFRWDPEEVIEIPPDRVLIANRVRGRGRGSDVEVNARGAQLWRVTRDKITEVCVFQSKEAALRFARLERLENARLYFVCEARPGGSDPHALLEAALDGGTDLVQLREKEEIGDQELVAAARPFRETTREHGAVFILNDRPELVRASEADGVHVGQDDMPVREARRVAGRGALIGLSTHSSAEVDAACAAEGDDRPDQISVGPVWETPTKEGRPATGLELIEHAAEHATLPWFAIGGIDPDNVGEVIAAGARCVVVVRAIRDAADPKAAARALREALEAAG
jgi:thiamine-phosphate pyrophosphorylase